MDNLTEFCKKKKIDPEMFKNAHPIEWEALEKEFSILGYFGFDSRKKFMINRWRLEFPAKS